MCGRYKHCRLIDPVPDCPPSNAVAEDCEAYHFVSEPLGHANNFRPAKIKQPQRGFKPHQHCSACGLSMYDTKQHAQKFYGFLKSLHKNVGASIGSHLAHARLLVVDGEHTQPDDHGHFDFFEFKESNIAEKFAVVGPLP